jgi:tetratricopeptide (TPR) repeat protein
MNNELYINQLLDEYIQGKLSRKDAVAELVQQGVADAAFELDLHKAAVTALRQGTVIKQVKNIHQHYAQQKQSARIFTMKKPLAWMLRVAAVFLIALGAWFTYQYTTISSEKMYAQIYQAYNVNTDRAAIGEIVTHQMVEQFKAGDFPAVIKTYQGIPATNNREKFLTAIALQETGRFPEAILLLEQLVKENEEKKTRLYQDEAEFYLGLNYLKIKNNDAAKRLFKKIHDDPGHTFHERISQSVLQKMKWLR